MRIALYHHAVPGGTKRHLYEIAKQMKKEGHFLGFFRPSTECDSFLPVDPYLDVNKIYPSKPYRRWNARLPLLRKYLDLIKLKLYLEHMKKLSREIAADIDSGNFDFVFLLHGQPVQSTYLLRYLKTPSIYYCAEPVRALFEPQTPGFAQKKEMSLPGKCSQVWYQPANRIRAQLLKRDAIENARHAALLLTNSHYSLEYIYKAYGIRVQVSYLGVDEKVFSPQPCEKEHAVLTVGRLSPLKGQDFVIQALGLLPQELRPALYMVSDSCDENSRNFLSKLAEINKVEIKFFINIPDEELVTLYNRVKAFVYAPIREPFGLVILEAMACGTPVIGVQEGGAGELLKDGINGFIRPREVKKFSEVIEFVLRNKELAETIGRNARNEILKFWTWGHAYQRMMVYVQGLSEIKNQALGTSR